LTRALVLVGAAVLAAAVLFRWWLPSERVTTPAISRPDTRLDYRLEDFKAHFHDEQGRPELLVRGPSLEHDAESRVVTLRNPEFPELLVQGPSLEHDAESRVVTLRNPEFEVATPAEPWKGRANQGVFEREFDTLRLVDEVELWRDGPKGRLIVTTQALQHQRPARTISADVPVILTRPGTELNAGGLMIQLDTETVALSDDVHIQAQPAALQN